MIHHTKPKAHLSCLIEACKRLGVEYKLYNDDINLLTVFLDKPYHFANSAVPLNIGADNYICKDKTFARNIVSNVVSIPKGKSYLDPAVSGDYVLYRNFNSLSLVVDDIVQNFNLPVIIKPNRGSFGTNVSLVTRVEEIEKALEKIFNKKSFQYDYVALVEEYIKPLAEYRIVFLNHKPVLLYKKDNHQAEFVGNLSPLHYRGAKASLVTDTTLIVRLTEFLNSVFSIFPIEFAGFDVIETEDGDFRLIEINGHPGFDFFLRDNDREVIIDLYRQIIVYLGQKNKAQ